MWPEGEGFPAAPYPPSAWLSDGDSADVDDVGVGEGQAMAAGLARIATGYQGLGEEEDALDIDVEKPVETLLRSKLSSVWSSNGRQSETPAFKKATSSSPKCSRTRSARRELALATLVTIVPVLIVFLFSQSALVAGMLAGATKE